MKKVLIISLQLCISCLVFAQDDLAVKVKKIPTLTISPDSMYFDSHIARTFTIGGIRVGCKAKGVFGGGNLRIHNNSLTLEPVYVYRASDISRFDRKYLTGFRTTGGDFDTAYLDIKVYDSDGRVKAYLNRKCYIKAEPHPRSVQLSSETFDPEGRAILKMLLSDSSVKLHTGK